MIVENLLNGTVYDVTEEFNFLQTKPKGVTIQRKALDKYILIVLFVLLLKRVQFLANET